MILPFAAAHAAYRRPGLAVALAWIFVGMVPSIANGADTPQSPAGNALVRPQSNQEPSFDWRKWQIQIVDGPFQMKYSRKGLQLQTNDGRYTARIRWRMQPRYAYPYDDDPRRASSFDVLTEDRFTLNRARFKVDGKAIGGFVNYNYEHDLVGHRVLNLFADVRVKEWLQFRGGQWKSVFSSERAISSGSQQFVERSIVNREFTIDRQVGASVFGHLLPGSRGDSWYSLEILGGNGRWAGFDADSPMLVGRYQWNFLGEEMEEAGSDVEYHEEPAAFVAINGLRNRSRFTRFSSSGGGQLDGFAAGAPGQYSIKQVNGEFFFKYRGFSLQNENHWKNVYDNVNGSHLDLRGTYAQAGYFPHHVWNPVPDGLEIGYRWANVDPNTAAPADARQEHSLVVNLFLEGHNNKFSFECGRLSLDRANASGLSDWRYRGQWDVHF